MLGTIETRNRFSQLNNSVIWVVLALSGIGLVNLYSATATLSGQGVSPIFYSQLLWMLLAWMVGMLVWLIDYQQLERLAYPLFGMTLLGLLAVLLFGQEIAGHQSWLKLGPFHVQPSEFAKIGFLLAIAKYFASYESFGRMPLRELKVPFLILGIPLVLILLQGDLGTALFFVLTFATLVLFVGVRRKTLVMLTSISLVTVLLAYFFLLSPYQKGRLQTFLQPDLDPRGQGYQVIQSRITVGSGMLTGRGYLNGMQTKLQYLPERHTDFIFPVLAEEWGFIGSLVVVLLYFALIMAGATIASRARDRFGLLIALGVSSLLFWQVLINLGGTLGLLPLTGVTLPMLSYGGSSLMTVFIAIGILLNVRSSRYFF